MPDLLFVNDLPYSVLVSLFMVTRHGGEHRLLASRNVDAFGRVRFTRRTPVPVGARFFITFYNDMHEVLRVEAFLNRSRVTDTHVQSTGTTRLEGFICIENVMPDLLFINHLPYLIIVSLYMIEPSGEHRLLETRSVDGFGQVTFAGRTRVPRGARFYMLFRNNLLAPVRVRALLGDREIVNTDVQSHGTARLEGFRV